MSPSHGHRAVENSCKEKNSATNLNIERGESPIPPNRLATLGPYNAQQAKPTRPANRLFHSEPSTEGTSDDAVR
jgi:hypothetical protein